MSRSMRDKVVVVTGATAGVGRAITRAFAKDGAKLVLLARDQGRLDATRREVEELGGRALALSVDVADAPAMFDAARQAEDTFGAIDIWVNNAMTSVFAELDQVEPDEYRRVTDVVYHGTVYGTMAALRHMLRADRGHIICIGSALAFRGIPLQAAYCGAKHAIQGMFESLRAELEHKDSKVRLSSVHLPAMNTPQFSWVRSKLPRKAQPVPPIFQPEVAADAVLHVARTGKRQMYVGFPTVKTVWGDRLAPWVADLYLGARGYASQQRDELDAPARPDNLWAPVPGSFAAHGEFDHRAKARSWQVFAVKHRAWLAPLASVVLVAGVTKWLTK